MKHARLSAETDVPDKPRRLARLSFSVFQDGKMPDGFFVRRCGFLEFQRAAGFIAASLQYSRCTY